MKEPKYLVKVLLQLLNHHDLEYESNLKALSDCEMSSSVYNASTVYHHILRAHVEIVANKPN